MIRPYFCVAIIRTKKVDLNSRDQTAHGTGKLNDLWLDQNLEIEFDWHNRLNKDLGIIEAWFLDTPEPRFNENLVLREVRNKSILTVSHTPYSWPKWTLILSSKKF